MLAALEHPSEPERSRPSQPNLSVIPGGAAQAEPVEEDDLLATILKGVRGV